MAVHILMYTFRLCFGLTDVAAATEELVSVNKSYTIGTMTCTQMMVNFLTRLRVSIVIHMCWIMKTASKCFVVSAA